MCDEEDDCGWCALDCGWIPRVTTNEEDTYTLVTGIHRIAALNQAMEEQK